MIRRYTLDRNSFEQFLAAASLLQQFQRQLSRGGSDAQCLWMLVDLQRSIESGQLDVEAALERIPQVADQLIGGAGSGVWLFSDDDQFAWRAGAVAYASNERLRLEILHRLAAIEDASPRPANRHWDAGYYPGCIKSLLVEPIRQGSRIAGAIASFSTEFDAFTERESSKLRLLAGLLSQAVDRASRMGFQQASALEQTAMRQLASRLVPKLQSLAEAQASKLKTDDQSAASVPVDDEQLAAPAPVDLPPVPSVPAEEEEAFVPLISANVSEVEELPSIAESAESEIDRGTSPIEEIYVPGLGVRSALYDDDVKPPSQFWAHLRSGVRSAFTWAGGAFRTVFQGIGGAGAKSVRVISAGGSKSISAVSHAGSASARVFSAATSSARSRVHQAAQHRPKLPSIPSDAVREGLRHIGSSCRSAASRAGSQLRSAASHMPKPTVSQEAVEHTVQAAEVWTGKALRKIGRGLRDAPNVIPDIPTLPADQITRPVARAVTAVCASASRAGHRLGREFRTLSLPELDLRKLNTRAVRRGIPAVFVLLIMLAFLLSQVGFHKALETASASTKTAVTTPAAVILPAPKLELAPKKPAADLSNAPTHRKVTDREIRDDLANMTRYEIATARRAAQFGDDVSAFQLGMAYETGYDVPQSCSKAAEWVHRAAEAGSAAAAYNLGLRYRDGDGVAPDPQQAVNWLRKAADHRYPNAGNILVSLGH
jgi:hypothetical protein